MRSRTVADRFTLFGDLFDGNDAPVLVVLDPNPIINGSYDMDVISVSSAYGKDTKAQDFIDKSEMLYVDKTEPINGTRPVGSTCL